MRTFILILGFMFLSLPAHAGVLDDVYGSVTADCVQDADADIADVNRLGPLEGGKRYVVYCHDGAGSGAACRCLQGPVTVSAIVAVNDGITLFAGEKMIVRVSGSNRYVSCKVFADDMFVDACKLN